MGKKRDWFCVVKKAFSPDSKKSKETSKSKKKWLGNSKNSGPAAVSLPPQEPATPKPTPTEPDILPDAQNEHKKHAYSVALATAMAAAAGVVAARAAADGVRPPSPQSESEERTSVEVVHAASAQGKSSGKDVVEAVHAASVQRKSSGKTAAGAVHFASVQGESSEMIVAAEDVHAASVQRNSLEITAAEAVHFASLPGESSEKITAAGAVHVAPAQRKSFEKTTAEAVHISSSEKKAAIKIQTAFRGYSARRELGGLRRLKSYIQGQSMKQATTALRCMQTLARVQSQIRARRLRMSEENRMLQQQLQKKREKEQEEKNASMASDWRGSKKSKEQSEAIKQNRQQAAKKRERALAYAFTHQRSWKVPSKAANRTVMEQQSPHWGWSWFERWMAVRPWEMSTSAPNNAALNTVATSSISNNDNNNNKPSATATPSKLSTRPSARPSLLSPRSKIAPVSPVSSKIRQPATSVAPVSPVSSKIRQPTTSVASVSSVSSKIRQPTPSVTRCRGDEETDRQGRRHSSIGGFPSSRDDERPGISGAAAPNSKTTTALSQITKTRQSRLTNSPGLGVTPERGLAPAAKKRLSFPLKANSNIKQSGPPSPMPDNNTAVKYKVKK
ncbi:hypothetical protein V6N13_121176 [Hibiscus sabdariffa]|uniref:Uncharacterized protein n=1 Tax=Hibiscus sabdariffa TaxID=183260 RepID=A0ABR2E6E6_9ROSI